MIKRIFYLLNLVRGIPAYGMLCLLGLKPLLQKETEGYRWYLEENQDGSFFSCFQWLMWRCDCFRTQILFRCMERSSLCSYILRVLYPPKKDLEICGTIGEGLVIYHGHGTVLAAHSIGRNFSVYQGVTLGRNPKPGQEICNPIIGDNVTVFANAVVAGGITIGDNVQIGAGAVVMKDVPANSVVMGNPCVIRTKTCV